MPQRLPLSASAAASSADGAPLLPAGDRALDAALAVHWFGWEWKLDEDTYGDGRTSGVYRVCCDPRLWGDCTLGGPATGTEPARLERPYGGQTPPAFSSDVAAAMTLVTRLKADGWDVDIASEADSASYGVAFARGVREFGDQCIVTGSGPLPLAISRAADAAAEAIRRGAVPPRDGGAPASAVTSDSTPLAASDPAASVTRDQDAADAVLSPSASMAAIEAACFAVCRDNTADAIGEPDPTMGRFVCMNEHGDPIIDTDDPAEVIRELDRLWAKTSEGLETAEYTLATVRAELTAAQREAAQWRAYAEHQEGCRTCAEDGVEACEAARTAGYPTRATRASTGGTTDVR